MAEDKSKPVEKPVEKAQEATQAATASPRRRRYQTVIFQGAVIAMASAFAVLTVLAKSSPFFAVDVTITHGIQLITVPWFSMLMNVISWPGYPPQSFVIPVLLVVLIWSLGLRWEAVASLVVAVAASGIDVLVKDYIRRPRPSTDLVHVFRILNDYSFPSGHVVFYVAFFGFLMFLAFALLKDSVKRTLLVLLFGILILLVGPSRIYTGEHWASDVGGAYLLGALILMASIAFYRWGKERFFVARAQPVQTHEAPPPAKAA